MGVGMDGRELDMCGPRLRAVACAERVAGNPGTGPLRMALALVDPTPGDRKDPLSYTQGVDSVGFYPPLPKFCRRSGHFSFKG